MNLRYLVTKLIYGFFILVELFLALRLILKLFGANAGTPFVNWVYEMSGVLLDPFRGIFPMEQLEQMGRQNMALFENAMKMLNPFGQMPGGKPSGGEEKPQAQDKKGENIEDLKAQLNEMQAQLAKLVKDRE